MRAMSRLWTDDDALTTIEYALLLAVLVVGAIAAFQYLGLRVERSALRARYALLRVGRSRPIWWLSH